VSELRFVVQLHRARRLHYDFRLEVDGVLVSWAVPKGPSLDPKVRRAAFHVGDHPIEYVAFEGVIPSGTYGGGDVIVWDTGTWVPYKDPDPAAAVAAGELHIELHGEKLRGRFVIVRTRGDEWLLLHKRDEHAVDGWDPAAFPLSVLSGRSSDEVKADPAWLWRSDLPAAQAAVALKADPGSIQGAGPWEVFGRRVSVTDPDRVLLDGGDRPITTLELLRYTTEMAPVVLPYLQGRAFTLPRRKAPDWLPRWRDPGSGTEYLVAGEAAAMVWAAGAGRIEWASKVERGDGPAIAFADLTGGWEDLLVLARLHRAAFEHLGVAAWPQLDGRGGLQDWVRALCRSVAAVVPDVARRSRMRPGSFVAPYSPRARPGAPVAAPIAWDELDDPALRPDGFTIRTIGERLSARGDLFSGVLHHAQRLPPLQ